jgi:predicted anti-sigma-YlaC factor YlaD
MELTSQLCARARFWASLRLDGELSELEGALLDAHLARCEACSAVAREFGVLTGELRARPLEHVAPVTVRPARSPRRVFAGAMVAAVLAAGVLLGGLVRGQVSRDALPTPHPVAVVASLDTPDQLRKLRRTTLLNERHLPRDISAEPV